MWHNMQKKHATFHRDWTIGGAITIKKVSFLLGVQERNYGKSCWNIVNNENHTEMWCIMVNHAKTWSISIYDLSG